MKFKFHLINFPVVDIYEGWGPLQVLQVDVVDDAGVNDHVILE